MGRTSDRPGFSSDMIAVRNDLKSTITSAKALKGRLVGINTPAPVLHFLLGRFMESEGLTIDDMQTLNMDWPNRAPGMETHAIDAAMVVEPFATEFTQKKISTPLRRAADFMSNPPLEASILLYSKTWTDKNPDEAKAFSVAYLKGVRDYVDAMHGGPKRAEVVAICAKYTSLKDKAIYDKIQWTYMDANGEVSIAGLKDQQNWYIKQGFMAHPTSIEAMIDRRFLDYALEKLGRVDDK